KIVVMGCPRRSDEHPTVSAKVLFPETNDIVRLRIAGLPELKVWVQSSWTPHGELAAFFVDDTTYRPLRGPNVVPVKACLCHLPPYLLPDSFVWGSERSRQRRNGTGDDGQSNQNRRKSLHLLSPFKNPRLTPGRCARAYVRAVSARAHMPSQSRLQLCAPCGITISDVVISSDELTL
ncbi:MAG: hypothetical protein UY59_C0025G0001, partial [Candidatus Kaiserbacteria bacterium GW2011_GWA1_50_28]